MITDSKWKYFFLFLILCDIVYTFIQNTNTMMLDGDMAGIILTIDAYKKVMSDPFGLSVLLHGEHYAAPNRFFTHFFMQKYFQFMPFFLQLFKDPVDSIFLTVVIARTLMHVGILYLIAIFISGRKNMLDINLLTAALIITPLFQVNGYHTIMAITINSITYSFFYSLPLIFILLYFWPFFNHYYYGKPFLTGFIPNLLLCLLALFIAFGGPLGPPEVLIIILLLAALTLKSVVSNENQDGSGKYSLKLKKAFQSIPVQIKIHFFFITILCLYSLYLGSFNTENEWTQLSIQKRYELLWIGIWKILTKKIGVSLLLGLCIINCFLLSGIKNKDTISTLKIIRFLSIFALIYVFLLPLGGYRSYRPYILRFDTFSPVTVTLIIIFGLTTLRLLAYYRGKIKVTIILIFVIVAAVYTNADRFEFNVNQCQRDYLRQIAKSQDPVVELHGWCSLFRWDKNIDPNDSHLSAEFIQFLGITKEKKLHYHPD